MSSPSRPASQALIKRSTSFRCINRLSKLKRAFVFSIGLSSNSSGMIGKFAKLHLPRFTSISLGNANSTKCPTAEEMIDWSLSKKSSCFLKPPRERARSAATLGFSAMMSDLDIFGGLESRSRTSLTQFYEVFTRQLLNEPLQLKAEESRRDSGTWQIAFR